MQAEAQVQRVLTLEAESQAVSQSWSPGPRNVRCLSGEPLAVKGSGTASAAIAPAGRAGNEYSHKHRERLRFNS